MSESDSESKKKKIPVISIIRKVIQLLSFFLVNYVALELIFNTEFDLFQDILSVLPFLHSARNAWTAGAGLIEYMFYTIAQGKIPYLIFAIIGLLGLFTGRIFCGWMCPTGFLQDLFSGLAGENRRLSLGADKGMKKFKNYIFGAMLILIVPLGYYRVNDAAKYFDYSQALGNLVENPTGIFSFSEYLFATFPNAIKSIFEDLNFISIFDKEDPWKGVLFVTYLIIIAISVYYPRFYCKYMCPYAAAISIFSDYSLLKLKRLPTRCPGRKECGVCERVCDMQVRILDEPFGGYTGNGECILCLKCLEECPHDAIKWKFGA
jgi:ferredoxin-type protein NapH